MSGLQTVAAETSALRRGRRKSFRLRPYQAEAVEAADAAFHSGAKRAMIVIATGGGKTVIFAKLAQRRMSDRVIVLAHREELLEQARDKIGAIVGTNPGLEQGKHRAKASDAIVVASIPTLATGRTIEGKSFGLAVVDEAHHAGAASYLGVLKRLRPNHTLGVTATPDRTDNVRLSDVFGQVVYAKTLLDLIRDGYLTDIRVRTLPISIDLSRVRTEMRDYKEADLGKAVEPALEELARLVANEHRDRKLLTFCPLRETSRRWTQLLRDHGLAAAHVDGESKDRKAILDAFARNEVRFLSNASLLTEGYDEPSIDTVLNLRPTQSRTLFSQIVGRGTRLYPRKTHLLLLDPLFQAERTNPIQIGDIVADDRNNADAITYAMRSGRVKLLKAATKSAERVKDPATKQVRTPLKGMVTTMSAAQEREGYEASLADLAKQTPAKRNWSMVAAVAGFFFKGLAKAYR